mgnify:CR=1 FL=1
MPRSRKVIRYNKKNQRKKLNRKSKKKSLKKRSLKKRSLKKRSLKNKLHRGGSYEAEQKEGFFSNMTNIISNVFKKKKKDEYNFIDNSQDGLDKAEKMLINYSKNKDLETQIIPKTELKIVYDNQV